MCGPSSDERGIETATENFAGLLRDNYGELFSEQQDVLNGLNKSLSPIVAAGPNQTGMSGAEVSALQTSAINNAGAASKNAEQAARTFGAGEGGGGTSGVTSGITKQIEGAIAGQEAGTLGTNLTNIQEKNYDIGNQNYWRAVGGEQALGAQFSPNAAMSGSEAGESAAFGEANQINTQENAVGQDIAGFLTAAAGSAGDIAKVIKG